jgi:hypothetical protein
VNDLAAGLFNFALSLVPSSLKFMIEAVGFAANRRLGLSLLRAAVESGGLAGTGTLIRLKQLRLSFLTTSPELMETQHRWRGWCCSGQRYFSSRTTRPPVTPSPLRCEISRMAWPARAFSPAPGHWLSFFQERGTVPFPAGVPPAARGEARRGHPHLQSRARSLGRAAPDAGMPTNSANY